MSNTKWVAGLCTGTYRETIMQGIAQVPGILIQITDSDLAWEELKQSQDEWTNAESVHLPGVARMKQESYLPKPPVPSRAGIQLSRPPQRVQVHTAHDFQKTAVRWPGRYGRTARQSQTDHSHVPCSCLALQGTGRERTMGMKDPSKPCTFPRVPPSSTPISVATANPKLSLWAWCTVCISDVNEEDTGELEELGAGRESCKALKDTGEEKQRVTVASEVLRIGPSGQDGCQWDHQPHAIVVWVAFPHLFYLQMLPKWLLEIHR